MAGSGGFLSCLPCGGDGISVPVKARFAHLRQTLSLATCLVSTWGGGQVVKVVKTCSSGDGKLKPPEWTTQPQIRSLLWP